MVICLSSFDSKGNTAKDSSEANERQNVRAFSIGESFEFRSKVMAEDRTINVYLPASYKESGEKRYPVIYLLDGSVDEDFIHVAGLVQFGSFPWIEMLPESIVIGIGNVDRKRDFTYPSNNEKDQEMLPTSGGSKKFVEMLESELQPLVERSYRTTKTNTLIGQSLGGLLAAEVFFKQSDLFDNFIIISPSIWWDDESLLKLDFPKLSSAKSVYVGVGNEGEEMERYARELFEKIDQQPDENLAVRFHAFPELDHGDTLHLALYDAFEKIFASEDREK